MTNLHVIENAEVDGPSNIPERLRQLADDVESGKVSAKTILVVSNLRDGKIILSCLGFRPLKSETMGILSFAQQMCYER